MMVLAAAAAAAFNLVCSGAVHHQAYERSRDEPYETVYRLDLKAKRWCQGDCDDIRKFSAITKTMLLLEKTEQDIMKKSPDITNIIDRMNGRHYLTVSRGVGGSAIVSEAKGQCERMPFSGFPKREARF